MMLPTGAPFDDVLNYIEAWVRLGYAPHVRSPRSFNEHVLSSKRRFRGDIALARRITDKFLFKEWLRELGRDDLVVPTLDLYDTLDEVRDRVFDRHTILKPTHLSGTVVPFHEVRKLTGEELSKVTRWLRTDYYRRSREKTYKGIKRRMICEPLLLDETGNIPMDYKFFMCAGKTLMIQVDIDRFTKHTRQLYSEDWELLDFTFRHPRNPVPIKKPTSLANTLGIASALSSAFSLCRVDLYILPGDIIKAGEITFFPEAGAGAFSPVPADFALGEKVKKILEKDALLTTD